MIALTDPQVTALINATRPLREHERVEFLAALKLFLADRSELGDGELARALRELQREYFVPPSDQETGMLETEQRRTMPRQRAHGLLFKAFRL
jgi:hypothetical protein